MQTFILPFRNQNIKKFFQFISTKPSLQIKASEVERKIGKALYKIVLPKLRSVRAYIKKHSSPKVEIFREHNRATKGGRPYKIIEWNKNVGVKVEDDCIGFEIKSSS